MIKDHYFVGRSERSEVRQVDVHVGLHVGLRYDHSDGQSLL